MRYFTIFNGLFIAVIVFSLGFVSQDFQATLVQIAHSHPQYQRGFKQGYQDALEGFKNRYRHKKLAKRNIYEKGYLSGYRQAAYKTQQFDLFSNSPAKTLGSDFNGDGIQDVIVGATGVDRASGDGAGAAYVIFGSASVAGTKNFGTIGSPDVTFLGGESNASAGINVGSAGDLNGDGMDDFFVAANQHNGLGTDRGVVFIVLGSTTALNNATFGSFNTKADITFLGKADTNYLGSAVSSAGDMNGDGFDDVAIGAWGNDDGGSDRGAVYVFLGAGNLSGTKNLAGIDSADLTILGKGNSEKIGGGSTNHNHTISSAGDVNGDGFDDIIVGSVGGSGGGGSSSGVAYVFFGSSSLSGNKNLAGIGSADFTVFGGNRGGTSSLGQGTAGGDINGDGFDDIVVSAYGDESVAGTNRGAVYAFFGGTNLSGVTKDLATGTADFTIIGRTDSDGIGNQGGLSIGGDLNDDGFDDIIIGARLNDFVDSSSGAAYIFFGSATLRGTEKILSGISSADVTITGKAQGDYLGTSTGAIGDINNDGIADMIVGASSNDDGGSADRGAAYVIFGGVTKLSGNIAAATAADVLIYGKAGSDTLGVSAGGGRRN